MRVMVIVKASKESEAGVLPRHGTAHARWGKYNEQLVKAGIMLAGDGLQPTSKGKRVKFSGDEAHGDRRAVHRNEGTDCRVLDLAGAVDGRGGGMAEACPNSMEGSEVEIRPVFEAADFGENLTPELKEQEPAAAGADCEEGVRIGFSPAILSGECLATPVVLPDVREVFATFRMTCR